MDWFFSARLRNFFNDPPINEFGSINDAQIVQVKMQAGQTA